MIEPTLDVRLYPMDAIEAMRTDGYDPFVIGSAHDLARFDQEKEAFLHARNHILAEPIVVAHEILPPVQLQYIKDFLVDEREYKEHETVKGVAPEAWRIEALGSYRRKLDRHHTEALAIWLLDNEFDVVPLEHDDALEWGKCADADPLLYAFIEETYGPREVSKILRFYKDIDRDCHNLRRMNELRPHIVSVGCAHAVVYDNLLGRTHSDKSVYVPSENRNFLIMWADAYIAAQQVYMQFHQK